MTTISDDSYMDKMRGEIRAARGWNFTAGIFFALIWVFAFMFALNEDGFMGLGILVSICGMMICFGQSFTAGIRIATEMSSLHTLAMIQLSAAEKTSQGSPQRPWLVDTDEKRGRK